MSGRSAKGADPRQPSYSLGEVCRITGLSPHVVRAWERRYGAVSPARTPGGTRRYRQAEVERLRWLAAAAASGSSIGEIASLGDAELRRLVVSSDRHDRVNLDPILDAAERLDTEAVDRLLGLQLAALGPVDFSTRVAAPFLQEVGDRWQQGRLCVASEHLASAAIRSLLGAALRQLSIGTSGPVIVFTTLPGDRHELGPLIGAVVAAAHGADAVYLGPDLPAEEIARAAMATSAAAVAIGVSIVGTSRERERGLATLDRVVRPEAILWVGGAGSEGIRLPERAERIHDVADLEHKVSILRLRMRRGSV